MALPVLARRPGAEARQRRVDLVLGEETAGDVEQFPPARARAAVGEKTDDALARMHGDAVAVAVFLGRRHDRAHVDAFLEVPQPPQHARDLLALGLALFPGGEMLVTAPAAPSEVRARRLHAVRRAFLHRQQPRFEVTFVFADDLHPDRLSHRDERHEDHPAVFRAAHAATAEGHFVDEQLQKKNRDGPESHPYLDGNATGAAGITPPVRQRA